MATKQVIVIRKDLNMRKGKMVAQGSHASMAFLTLQLKNKEQITVDPFLEYLEQKPYQGIVYLNEEIVEWINSSFRKICVSAKDEEELEEIAFNAENSGLMVRRIVDDGLTEFNGIPTFTSIAIGPHEDSKFEGITSHLPLL